MSFRGIVSAFTRDYGEKKFLRQEFLVAVEYTRFCPGNQQLAVRPPILRFGQLTVLCYTMP